MGKIKFSVCADVHLDIAKDGGRRIDTFLKKSREEDVDFIIHLGDFAYPNDTSKTKCPIEMMPENVRNAYERPSPTDKEEILRRFSDFEKPAYHTMGNHDFDFLSPEDTLRMYGLESGYYSFHMNGWHFIVLDANYFRDKSGNYVHYDCGQYFYEELPYINPEQLEWLREELRVGEEPVVFFSHQALFECDGGILNLDEFRKIINEARENGRKIRMCLSGHLHQDTMDYIDGIYYYNVTSLFGQWVGEDYQYARYTEKTEEAYPNLRFNIPYSKPIFSIVTLDDEGFHVPEMKGRIVPPGPRKLGCPQRCYPTVKERSHKWSD